MTTETPPRIRVPQGGVGESPLRPDGVPKLRGEFDYAQDLSAEGMLWAATVRSPHARARIVSIDLAPALAIGGVHACLGAMVARISVKIIFEEFLQRYPEFSRMQQQLPWMPSTTFRSPMRLDLAVN